MTRRRKRSGTHERPPAPPRGFTLLELLTTVTVMAVLLTVGVPSFVDVVRSNRAAANANDLVSALSIARSEAIRRGARIGVCQSSNGTACTGTWSDGWIVFRDTATNDAAPPSLANEDDILRVWPAPSGGPTVTATGDGGGAVTWIRFQPRGDARTNDLLPVTIRIEPNGCRGDQGRNIRLNAAGRTIVERFAC